MKKLSLLVAMIAFVCGNAFAQFSYDFEDGVAGTKIAQTYGDPWTTWSNEPGGDEDGVFAEQNSMAAHFTYGVDQVIELGNLTTGVYEISFDMYIPDGKDAYNNILHIFNGTGSEWATEVYYKTTSNGTGIKINNQTVSFDCPYDTWFTVKYMIDLDNDEAAFYIDDEEITTWQYSTQAGGGSGTRQLGAMDFYPPTSAAKSDYYIDNLSFEPLQNIELVVDDDFELYTEGNKIATEAMANGIDWWTTWSNEPGGDEDGVVATLDGTKAGHLTYGNDQVLLLGDATSGTYVCMFDMYIPDGKDAYNNVLHIFNGTGSEWATEVYYKTTSNGTGIKINNQTVSFDCPYDTWFTVKYMIDLDNDEAAFYIDDEEITTWQYSTQAGGGSGTRQLGAMDFYPPTSAAKSDYYIDNVSVYKLGGASAPVLSVDLEDVYATLGEDDITSVDVAIANDGNSIGEWNAYIDFGHGGAGSQTAVLCYHNGEENSGIGSTGGPYTREMAIRLPSNGYGGSMGMRIISTQFQVSSTYKSADNTYIFRLYGQGANNQPGEMLAEKTVVSSELGVWLTATFDEEVYLNGQTIWATVQLEQTAGEYPLTMDGGEYGETADGNWLSTQGGTFDHCYSAGDFGGAWLISVNCQGEHIPGSWVSLNKYNGSIPGGATEVVTMTFNSIGLDDVTTYTASMIVNTNDEELPRIEIPITLDVNYDDVAETENTMAIYPNPAVNQVTIAGENLSHVAIYNVTGQLVRVVRLDSNTINLDMEAGVYFFSVFDNEGANTVTRVVVTK